MFDTLFPWFHMSSLSKDNPNFFNRLYEQAPGFAHVFYNDTGRVGNFIDYTHPIIDNACKILNVSPLQLYYARSFLQMPLTTHSGLTIPHVDIPTKEHLVLLYYVLDADGETVFFNRNHDFVTNHQDPTPLVESDILFKIKPKQGSVLAFNGKMYHANILPKETTRCVINFNLKI